MSKTLSQLIQASELLIIRLFLCRSQMWIFIDTKSRAERRELVKLVFFYCQEGDWLTFRLRLNLAKAAGKKNAERRKSKKDLKITDKQIREVTEMFLSICKFFELGWGQSFQEGVLIKLSNGIQIIGFSCVSVRFWNSQSLWGKCLYYILY